MSPKPKPLPPHLEGPPGESEGEKIGRLLRTAFAVADPTGYRWRMLALTSRALRTLEEALDSDNERNRITAACKLVDYGMATIINVEANEARVANRPLTDDERVRVRELAERVLAEHEDGASNGDE